MRMIWNKGHRIRASDKHLVYHFSIGTLLFVFMAVLLLLKDVYKRQAEEMAKKYDCAFVDNEMPYGRVPQGHPVIVDYFLSLIHISY